MKKNYITPEILAYNVAAERGYQASASFGLDGFGTEKDETSW